jgi:hypothetical protein
MREEHTDGEEAIRPFGFSLLTGLYGFFFMVSVTTFGNPFPFFGSIYLNGTAKILVFVDSLVCLYLIFGIIQRQRLTWHLLLAYNLLQIVNIVINLSLLTAPRLEQALGTPVNAEALTINNVAAALALLLLTQYIYRHREYFSNRSRYLF